MPRNKSTGGKRTNIPAETLERARAELRGEIIADVPDAIISKAKADLNRSSTPKMKKAAPAGPRRIPTIAELQEEYAYVGREMRMLAVLAVSMLALIIVASFVLNR
jgi:hypothetical protein